MIVCGQTRDDENQILFKVMEYKSKHSISLNNGLTFNTSYTPLDPSQAGGLMDKMKEQITAGIQVVTDCIQGAIDETPVTPPAAQ